MLVEKYQLFQGNDIFNILELPFKKKQVGIHLAICKFHIQHSQFQRVVHDSKFTQRSFQSLE